MKIDVPFDLGQKVFVVDAKRKVNKAERIICAKEMAVYQATVTGIFIKQTYTMQEAIYIEVTVNTDLDPYKTGSSYCYVKEAKIDECFQTEDAAKAYLKSVS